MDKLTNTLSDATELIIGKLGGWLEQLIEMLPNFVVAVLIVLLFVFIGKLIRRGIHKLLSRFSDSKSLNGLISTIAYVAIVLMGGFIALSILNLDKAVTSLLAGAGIIGLALGFAFQDIASNFMSGIIMAIRKPIQIGDLVETNGIFGTVKKLTLRSTEIISLQGQHLIVPNKLIFENPIKNFTTTGERRIDLECGVSYGDDLKEVRRIAIQAIESLDCINKEKGVSLYFKEFGDSSINFQIRYWILGTLGQKDYLHALSEGVISLKAAFDAHDIMIPFPIRTLDFGIRGGEKLNEVMSMNK